MARYPVASKHFTNRYNPHVTGVLDFVLDPCYTPGRISNRKTGMFPMPLRPDQPAPYAPPSAILDLLDGYRDRGLQTPFTPEVLIRAGVNESLVNRTLRSLEGLDLIDSDGRPTEVLETLARASSDEYQDRLASWVRSTYQEVFQFTDPATDDQTRVADAFRAYEPRGQRSRMVTLFLALCGRAGIISEEDAPKKKARTRKSTKRAARSTDSTPKKPAERNSGGGVVTPSGLPPAVAGLMASVPTGGKGWTAETRDQFLQTLRAVLDFTVPLVDDDDDTDD